MADDLGAEIKRLAVLLDENEERCLEVFAERDRLKQELAGYQDLLAERMKLLLAKMEEQKARLAEKLAVMQAAPAQPGSAAE